MKKLFLTLSLLVTAIFAKAQANFIAGVGADFYASRYIVDSKLTGVDLDKLHKAAFNTGPHINVGIDIANRFRILTGFASTSRTDNFDQSSLSFVSNDIVKTKNLYSTIPLSVTINTLDADKKSRFPIGVCLDFSFLRLQKISSPNFDTTLKYSEMKDGEYIPGVFNNKTQINTVNQSMVSFGITLGYGYNITDNLGFDALLFAKYDASDFSKSYDLYDHYGFIGLNLSVFYKFGDVK